MKLTVEKILNAKSVLEKLANQKMTALIAYKIQRNIGKLNAEVENFQYVTKDLVKNFNEGTSTQSKEDYLKELNDLLKAEIEVDILQIKVEDIN